MSNEYTLVNEFYPPASTPVNLLGTKDGRFYIYVGTFVPDDQPSAAFYLNTGVRTPLAENFITHWAALPALPGSEEDDNDV